MWEGWSRPREGHVQGLRKRQGGNWAVGLKRLHYRMVRREWIPSLRSCTETYNAGARRAETSTSSDFIRDRIPLPGPSELLSLGVKGTVACLWSSSYGGCADFVCGSSLPHLWLKMLPWLGGGPCHQGLSQSVQWIFLVIAVGSERAQDPVEPTRSNGALTGASERDSCSLPRCVNLEAYRLQLLPRS